MLEPSPAAFQDVQPQGAGLEAGTPMRDVAIPSSVCTKHLPSSGRFWGAVALPAVFNICFRLAALTHLYTTEPGEWLLGQSAVCPRAALGSLSDLSCPPTQIICGFFFIRGDPCHANPLTASVFIWALVGGLPGEKQPPAGNCSPNKLNQVTHHIYKYTYSSIILFLSHCISQAKICLALFFFGF